MACQTLKSIKLDPTASGETWDGLTFSIDSSDDTKFAAALSRVRMTWRNTSGQTLLTLDSNTAGHITITTATAYAWAFTVEPRALNLAAGMYSWAIEVTDADGVVDKDFVTGSHQILSDPHI